MNDSDLKYIQRVLESNAPDEDRERAAQMVRDIRRSYGQAPAASPDFPHYEMAFICRVLEGDHPEKADLDTALGMARSVRVALLKERAAQAPAASVEPVAWLVDWPDEPELGHYLAEAPADIDSGRSRALVFRDAAPAAAQAPQEPDEPLPPPGIHTAVHYAGWLRREAHRHQEPKASVLRQTARLLDVFKAECARLHQELIDAQAPAANGDAWKNAVDRELTTLQSTADSYATPAEAVKALIDWHVSATQDPAISELALDAARYRWLRRPDNPHGPSLVAFCKPDELDAAIDAARQEAK